MKGCESAACGRRMRAIEQSVWQRIVAELPPNNPLYPFRQSRNARLGLSQIGGHDHAATTAALGGGAGGGGGAGAYSEEELEAVAEYVAANAFIHRISSLPAAFSREPFGPALSRRAQKILTTPQSSCPSWQPPPRSIYARHDCSTEPLLSGRAISARCSFSHRPFQALL